MPRKPRIEIGGGLYHVITRGNNRRNIFRSHNDYLRFTSTLERQKAKLPFYLYAYCLMPNHVHLLFRVQDVPMAQLMDAWKGYTAKEANKILGSVYAALSEQRQPLRPGDDPAQYRARAVEALEKSRALVSAEPRLGVVRAERAAIVAALARLPVSGAVVPGVEREIHPCRYLCSLVTSEER